MAARRRLHDLGVTQQLFEAVAEMSGASAGDEVLDTGCGEGFYAGSLATRATCSVHGVDISLPAIQAAARRYPQGEWVVANADGLIPYTDRSFSLILSITARRNPGEFARVIAPGGRLLVGIPAPDDLIELRGAGRDRVARTVEEFAGYFRLREQRRATVRQQLDDRSMGDVLFSIYRPLRRHQATAGEVTLSLDLLSFEPDAHAA